MKTITIPVFGGLGNQMFQVAHGLDLGRRTGAEPRFVDLSTVKGRVPRRWGLHCFNISREPLTTIQAALLKIRISVAVRLQKLSPKLSMGVLSDSYWSQPYALTASPKICSGYWQGERFFKESAILVKETFIFPDVLEVPPGLDFASARPIVAVHVRRGDYVTDPVAHAYHFVCGEIWYLNAMQQMRACIPGAEFYVFSDDTDWAKTKFGDSEDVSIVASDHSAPAWNDMARMSRCQHFIISNSSYSWWASYLGKTGDSVILAPEFWFPGKPTRELPLYCPDWRLL